MSKTINKLILFGLALLAILVFGAMTASAQYYDDGSSYINQPPNPYPKVYAISPNIVNATDGAKTVTISGKGFTPNSIARWNGSPRPTTFIDSSHLLIQLSGNDLQDSSGRYINVFNSAPGGGYSKAVFLTISGYKAPAANVAPTTNNTYGNNTNNYNYGYDANTGANTNNSYQNQNGDPRENRENANSNEDESYSSLASNAIFGSNGMAPSGLIQWILFAIVILLIVIIARKLFGGTDRYNSTPLKHA